jgi:hypothetical protein
MGENLRRAKAKVVREGRDSPESRGSTILTEERQRVEN